MREDFAKKKAQWDNDKTSVERVQKIREEIEQVNNCLLYTSRQKKDINSRKVNVPFVLFSFSAY